MYKLILQGFVALCLISFVSYKLLYSDMKIVDIKNSGIKQVTHSITNDLDRAIPFIHSAGYKIFSIQAQLSLPPKVIATFQFDRVIDRATQEKVLEALDDNMIGKLVLSALMESFELDKAISIKNMELKRINITIGLPPAIMVDYR